MNIYSTLDDMAKEIHSHNVEKGFWPDGTSRNKGELFMLMVSELSEGYEAIRKGDLSDDKLPQYPGEHVELADALIRILDYCGAHNIPISEITTEKLNFNKTRPHKHGKNF